MPTYDPIEYVIDRGSLETRVVSDFALPIQTLKTIFVLKAESKDPVRTATHFQN